MHMVRVGSVQITHPRKVGNDYQCIAVRTTKRPPRGSSCLKPFLSYFHLNVLLNKVHPSFSGEPTRSGKLVWKRTKYANISTRMLPVVVLWIFIENKYFFCTSNLSPPGRSHVGYPFANKEQEKVGSWRVWKNCHKIYVGLLYVVTNTSLIHTAEH